MKVSGNYLPSISQPQLDQHEQTNIPGNHIVDPCNHQLFTTAKRTVPSRCGLESRQLTTPLANIYSRHMATIGWPQPKPPLSPLPVQNTETISNGTNERRTMRFYPNTFGNGGGQNKRTASTEPSAICLPAVDNIYYQPMQPPKCLKPSNTQWTLFDNTPTYTSLLHRGYSHTRLW